MFFSVLDPFLIWKLFLFLRQVRGNYYLSVNQLGAGARWRRTTGQEVYSPLLLAFTQEVWLDCSHFVINLLQILNWLKNLIIQKLETWTESHLTKSTAMESDYSLPLNVALITLEVTASLLTVEWFDKIYLYLNLITSCRSWMMEVFFCDWHIYMR